MGITEPQSSKTKSVLITYPFPLGKANGGARMTREIGRHLGRLGVRVTLMPVSTVPKSRFPRPKVAPEFLGYDLDAALAEDSVHVVRVAQNPLSSKLDCLAVRSAVVRFLSSQKADLVLSYFNEGAFLGPFVRSAGAQFGYIATWQSYTAALGPGSRGRVRARLRRWWNDRTVVQPYRGADVIFATSEFTKSELVNFLGVEPGKIRICHLGIDPTLRSIPDRDPDRVTNFIFFARLVPSKGIFEAIRAFRMVADSGLKDWTFRVFGDGDRARVQREVTECGLQQHVQVCEALDDAGLRRELTWAHAAVMPSHFEGFGLSIAEAQASGIPVIAYQAGAVPEVVEQGNTGLLAPLKNVSALADHIAALIQNPPMAQRMGIAARERSQKFTWEKTATVIQNFLNC